MESSMHAHIQLYKYIHLLNSVEFLLPIWVFGSQLLCIHLSLSWKKIEISLIHKLFLDKDLNRPKGIPPGLKLAFMSASVITIFISVQYDLEIKSLPAPNTHLVLKKKISHKKDQATHFIFLFTLDHPCTQHWFLFPGPGDLELQFTLLWFIQLLVVFDCLSSTLSFSLLLSFFPSNCYTLSALFLPG